MAIYSEIRPWGAFHVLEEGSEKGRGYKVKRIEVNAGGKLSLQSHKQRSEHWTCIRGAATVTLNEKTLTLSRGQSVDIPLGAKHRLENLTEETAEIIEVQFGDYLGEDDIIRYADVYNRS